jgi:hypothetical protein
LLQRLRDFVAPPLPRRFVVAVVLSAPSALVPSALVPPALSPLLLCSFRLCRLRRTRDKSVTAATKKRFAIASAVLTSFSLLPS